MHIHRYRRTHNRIQEDTLSYKSHFVVLFGRRKLRKAETFANASGSRGKRDYGRFSYK